MSINPISIAPRKIQAQLYSPDDPNITCQFVTMTPNYARRLLEDNTANRTTRRIAVTRLSHAMSRGEFAFNGDAVRIDRAGCLLDGQHRLLAIVASDTAHTILLVEGLPATTRPTIDVGIGRTAGDALGVDGVANSRWVAAVARTVWNYEDGGGLTTTRGGRPGPTIVQICKTMERHPALLDSVRPRRTSPVRQAWFSGFWYLASMGDAELAHWFRDRIEDGASINPRPAGLHPTGSLEPD